VHKWERREPSGVSGGAVREVAVDEHQSTDDQLLAARISLSEIDGERVMPPAEQSCSYLKVRTLATNLH
jgi:hypothetical protein